eukprot:COSAG02_NODE_702_length_18327_cov_85.154597_3_plen_137_part_00
MNSTLLANAATYAFKADSTAHWGPTIDGVETSDSPYNLTKQGQFFKGPLMVGTARDETCSLVSGPLNGAQYITCSTVYCCSSTSGIAYYVHCQEGRDWSFGLDETQFAADLVQEYGNRTNATSGGVNISKYKNQNQ